VLRINPIYRSLCPNCGGPIGYDRLSLGLPCSICLPNVTSSDGMRVLLDLEREGRLAGLKWVLMLSREFDVFSEYFRSKTGSGLWSAQASWARRLLSLDSFTIVAPTGVGKTTLLSVYTAYRAEVSGWRTLYLVPTGNLARQVYERISRYVDSVVTYYSTMPAKTRREALNAIEGGNYRVLVVTTGFLQRRFDVLMKYSPFNLIVVDDVDSMLRDGGNVDRTLMLLGYSEEAVRLAIDLVKTRARFFKASGVEGEEAVRSLAERVALLESKLRGVLGETRGGQLVVASATGRPRGLKHLIFKELLNFEVGGGGDYLRNVVDTYLISSDPLGDIVKLVKLLGPGGIVFVSQSFGGSAVNKVVEVLRREGLRVDRALSGSWRSIGRLEGGELDILVSISSRYGVAVRGLDAPKVVKYALFLGAPARSMSLEDSLINPRRLQRVLMYMSEEGVGGVGELLLGIQRLVDRIGDPTIIAMALRKGSLDARFEIARRAYEVAMEWVRSKVLELGRLKVGSMVFVLDGGGVRVLIPDALTYIQASGRTSRLLEGRMTLGLSIVIEPLKDLLEALEDRLRWFGRFSFRNLEDVDLDEVKELLERTRRGGGREVKVRTALLVVESPTKAKTIAWFWGRPSKRRVGRVTVYETSYLDDETGEITLLQVTATKGHLFDLVDGFENSVYGVVVDSGFHRPVYDFIKRCRSCGHQFTSKPLCPRCGSGDVIDSSSAVEALRKLSLEVEEVIVATDPDIEGEKIAWDVILALKPYNPNIRRARFNEVTRESVVGALKRAGGVNIKSVEAQMTRRIVDRWVGYFISEHLQKTYNMKWLGAGRVQSPILSWVARRYHDWVSSRGYIVCFKLEIASSLCINTKELGEAEELSKTRVVKVVGVSSWEDTLTPPPPYTTDTLLYDASRMLGLAVEKAMRVAQELFESGLITYHRTDSTRVSNAGIAVARSYMEGKGLIEEFRPRSWGEGGAHEAIRPTRPLDLGDLEKAVVEGVIRIPLRLNWSHRALYDLVFRRFMASQMKEAKTVKVRVDLEVGGRIMQLERIGGLLEEGFTKIYKAFKLEEWTLKVAPGSTVKVLESSILKASTTPLYTTGDLVKLMREKGIGRPSTYHKAIEANRRHGYIVVSRKRGYVIPTKLGLRIIEYLKTYFNEITSEEYTRMVEELLDRVENDNIDPNTVLNNTLQHISRRIIEIENIRENLITQNGHKQPAIV
jgi:reverse gyrase